MITLTMDDILTRNDLPVAAPLELQSVRLFEAYQYRLPNEGDENYDPVMALVFETSKTLDRIWYEPIPELWQPVFEQVTAVQTARKQQKLDAYWECVDNMEAGINTQRAAIQLKGFAHSGFHPTERTATPVTYDGGRWYVVTICTHCKERMVAEDKRAKFCSNRCQRERKRIMTAQWVKEHRRSKNLATKVCIQCGGTFSAKRTDAVLCGAACRKRAQRVRATEFSDH